MKKAISVITAAVTALVSLVSFSASAETERYIPTYYFKAEEHSLISDVTDSGVVVDKEILELGDITLDMGVYIEDTVGGIYYASAKWNCDSEYITFSNLINPKDDTGKTTTYNNSLGEFFSTNLTPFAYGVIGDSSEMTIPYAVDVAAEGSVINNNLGKNAFAFTYSKGTSIDRTPFEFLGATSDEFAFASFDATISKDTPEGVYEFYFMTEGQGDNVRSNGRFAYEGSDEFDRFIPEVRSFTVTVQGDEPVTTTTTTTTTTVTTTTTTTTTPTAPETESPTEPIQDKFLLGDVDDDKSVNSSDASYVLAEYALLSTGGQPIFTEKQNNAADVNKDKAVDASDASAILSYYASVATGGKYSGIEEFLGL